MDNIKPGELSYLSTPGPFPLSSQTLGQLVNSAAAKFTNSEAVYFVATEERLSFIEVNQASDRLAAGFLKMGLQPGDRVGIWGPNSCRWYITSLALAKAGIISVFLNPAYQIPEILYCINHVGMKGIVVAEAFKTQNYCEMMAEIVPELKEGKPECHFSEQAPTLTSVVSMEDSPSMSGVYSYGDLMRLGSSEESLTDLEEVSNRIDFDDICNIQFTSGTTGKSKAIMLTHHNLVNSSQLTGYGMKTIFDDRLCVPLPLFHIYGYVVTALVSLHYGSSIVFPSRGYDPSLTISICAKERCTALYGAPTMYIDMIKALQTNKTLNLDYLYKVSVAGAPCSEELRRQISLNFNLTEVHAGYGLTEASPTVSFIRMSDPEEVRSKTLGYPLDHIEVKIVDKEGRIVPVGIPGELCVRGFLTMRGYWRDPEKTREVFDDARWLHTGDLFAMEPSGHLRFVGRIKDMIIRGGENIYPSEIEEFLHKVPGIMEVHVFGIPDDRLGEVVAAWIRLKEGHSMTEEDVRNSCAGQIAYFKIPTYIKFTEEFPKTLSGKIQKFRLRELAILEIELVNGMKNLK